DARSRKRGAKFHLVRFHAAGFHLAINSEFANGHFSSTHCACSAKPDALASSATLCRVYLWLLSVQIVSPAAKSTVKSLARIVTHLSVRGAQSNLDTFCA